MSVYADLLRHRELFGSLFRRDLRARYKGTIFGVAWSLVNPLMLAAIYVLWMYQRTMTGPDLVGGGEEDVRDLDRREVGILAPLALALVLFGFYPMPLLNVINPYVKDTLQQVGVTDPSPTVQATSAQGGQQ